eukprot:1290502-Alexandrium_andersonii.AAC.1
MLFARLPRLLQMVRSVVNISSAPTCFAQFRLPALGKALAGTPFGRSCPLGNWARGARARPL